ncbi:MAG: PKD domain-containing protein [Cytophagales bacterium]|nr:PKD domain-containing protein [Cytophagales bacterium]
MGLDSDADGHPVPLGSGVDMGAYERETGNPVPEAPSNLQASTVSDSQIQLNWIDNSGSEYQFRLERKSGEGDFEPVATTAADQTAYTDVDLAPSTEFVYRLRARSTDGFSAYSNLASASTLDPVPTAPLAPEALAAELLSSNGVKLTWVDASNNELGFKVYRKKADQAYELVAEAEADATELVVNGQSPQEQYSFRLRSFNRFGASATFSNEVSVSVPDRNPIYEAEDAENVGTNLTTFRSGFTGRGYMAYVNAANDYIEWTVSVQNQGIYPLVFRYAMGDNNGRNYELRVNDSIIDPAHKFAFTGGWGDWVDYILYLELQAGANTVRLRSIGQLGGHHDHLLVPYTVTPGTPRMPTQGSIASISDTELALTWTDASDNETGYRIYQIQPDYSRQEVATLGPDQTSYTVSGLQPSTVYTFRVVAFNELGESPYLRQLSATTQNPSAQAGVIAYEGFDYTTGEKLDAGLSGGNGWAGPWVHDNTFSSVQSPGFEFTGLESAGNRMRIRAKATRPLFQPIKQASGSLWLGAFIQSGNSSRTARIGFTEDGSEVMIITHKPGALVQLDGTNSSVESSSSQRFVLLRLDFNPTGNTAYLWLDPDLSAEPELATAHATKTLGSNFGIDGVVIGHNNSGSHFSDFDEIRLGTAFAHAIAGSGPEGNLPPVATLTAPLPSDLFIELADIQLAATAQDSDGSIAKVEFFEGENKLGEDTEAPFELSWSQVSAGSYQITAVATDNEGALGTSSQLTITVDDADPVPSYTVLFDENNAQTLIFDARASLAKKTNTLTGFDWDFGDGQQGSGIQTTHTYAEEGVYTTSLTLTDDAGGSATLMQEVVIGNESPVAGFISGKSPTNPFTVLLDASASFDPDGVIAAYEWDFGDGNTQTLSEAATEHTFPDQGEYTISLRVIDGRGKSSQAAGQVSITNQSPAAAISFAVDAANALEVTFDAAASTDPDGLISSYVWDFGDGSDPQSAENLQVVHTYASFGTYTVALTVTDNNGATNQANLEITLNESTEPVAAFVVSLGAAGLVSLDASASASGNGSIATYFWDLGDGNTLSETDALASHSYALNGSFAITLTVTDNLGKTDEISQQVEITTVMVPMTQASFTYQTSGVSLELDAVASSSANLSPLTYFWDFGDGNTTSTTQAQVSYTYAQAGSYQVVLTILDAEQSSDDTTLIISVIQPELTSTASVISEPILFPNPSQGADYVCLGPLDGKGYLRVFGLEGKLVFELEVAANQAIHIPTDRLTLGWYLLTLQVNGETKSFRLLITP